MYINIIILKIHIKLSNWYFYLLRRKKRIQIEGFDCELFLGLGMSEEQAGLWQIIDFVGYKLPMLDSLSFIVKPLIISYILTTEKP